MHTQTQTAENVTRLISGESALDGFLPEATRVASLPKGDSHKYGLRHEGKQL